MQPHIEATLNQITEKIAALNTLRAGLLELFNGAPTALLPLPAGEGRGEGERPAKRKCTPRATRPASDREMTVTDAFREVIATLPGEFSNADVREKAIARFPAMKRKILIGTGTNLRFLEKKGEIKQTGREGRSSTWLRMKTGVQALHEQIHSEVYPKSSE